MARATVEGTGRVVGDGRADRACWLETIGDDECGRGEKIERRRGVQERASRRGARASLCYRRGMVEEREEGVEREREGEVWSPRSLARRRASRAGPSEERSKPSPLSAPRAIAAPSPFERPPLTKSGSDVRPGSG